jgi:hypothetical protein
MLKIVGGETVEMVDVEEVEIVISPDGKKMWINAPLCCLRIDRIGNITVNDMRRTDDADSQ